MSLATFIQGNLQLPAFVVDTYLQDLSDQDLMLRPLDNANHIAWQLGHVINAEHTIINEVCPGALPALPEGFAEKHSKEKAASNDPKDFLTKEEYLELARRQRAAIGEALAKLSDDELLKPVPEKYQRLGNSVGALFAFQSSHWMMHAGQWVLVRRKLGKPPLF